MRLRPIVVFGLLTGIIAAGYGVMFTVLDDFRDEYGIGETWLGAIVAAGFFSSFAAQITLAPLADRGHARRLVYVSLTLSVVGLIGMAAGTSVPELLGARLVMGLGAGMALPAIRRIVILAEPDQVGRNLGYLVSFDVVGFAAGPAVSAVLVPLFGIEAPFLVIAVVTASFAVLVRTIAVSENAEATTSRFAFDLLADRVLAGAVAMGATVFMMIGAFDALWAVVLEDRAAPSWVAGVGITAFAVPLIVLGSTGGRLAERVGPFRLGTVGLLAGATFMFGYGAMPNWQLMLSVSIVHAFSDALTVASSGIAVARAAPPGREASAQGLLGGIETIVGGLTAIAAGALYEHTGRVTTYAACAAGMVTLTLIGALAARPAWRTGPGAPRVHQVL